MAGIGKAKRGSTPKNNRKRPAAKPRVNANYNKPDVILAQNSPLYKDAANIKAYLAHDKAKTSIGDIFGGATQDTVNNAIASWKKDGEDGRYDEEWLREAMEAGAKRNAGEFDPYLNHKFQDAWAKYEETSGEEFSDADEEMGGADLGVKVMNGCVNGQQTTVACEDVQMGMEGTAVNAITDSIDEQKPVMQKNSPVNGSDVMKSSGYAKEVLDLDEMMSGNGKSQTADDDLLDFGDMDPYEDSLSSPEMDNNEEYYAEDM